MLGAHKTAQDLIGGDATNKLSTFPDTGHDFVENCR